MTFKIKYFLFLFFAFIYFNVSCQIKNAKITYKIKMNIQNDSIFKLENDRGKMVRLVFNEINSIQMELVYFDGITVFKEIPKIFISKKQESFQKLANKSARLNEVYYTNIENKTSSVFKTFGGVDYFITSDSGLNWMLINENKEIGGFNCQKAETIYTYKDRKDNYQNLKITAWYSPEIQISSGPKNYIGLPGLILELTEGDDFLTFQASKIQINSKDISKIHIPNDVENITQNEFSLITKESYNQFFKN
jgi:GLPGLI family protein